MEKWFKICEEKTTTISVSSSGSCDVDNMTIIDINIDAQKMKPCNMKGRDHRLQPLFISTQGLSERNL